MSEKYITLNHLETATKSLIAKIDEEINDLSPVAQSGDYEDLENKPNLFSGNYEDLINKPEDYRIYLEKTNGPDYNSILAYLNQSQDIVLHDDDDNYYYLTNIDDSESGTIKLTFLGENKKITYYATSRAVSSDFYYGIFTEEETTPDWEQNDSTADDYIENRTHWKEIDEDYVWIDETFSWGTSASKILESKPDETDGLLFLENETYTVIYDNISYQLTPYVITVTSNNNQFMGLGNSSYQIVTWEIEDTHDTSVPFLIYLQDYTCTIRRNTTSSDTSDHTISITGPFSIYHKLDSNYLNGKLISSGTGQYSEVFNKALYNTASGSYSHAEGYGVVASGSYSHAEGHSTNASASCSHAEGTRTTASGSYSHAEGYDTIASENYSHAEGAHATASGVASHAEGGSRNYIVNLTGAAGATTYTVTKNASAAKPPKFTDLTTADRIFFGSRNAVSFTVGEDSRLNSITFAETLNASSAWNNQKVTIGILTTAAGEASHAEGNGTLALSEGSHSEGIMTEAIGTASHAQNQCTVAQGNYQTAMGIYNIADTTSALIVGNGNQDAYSNAYTLDWSGNGVYAGKVTVGTAPTADMDVATKLYVDTAMSNVSTDLVGLTDTTITTPTDGQILIYDATNSKWINSNFTAVSAESDTNVNDMLDDFSLDYTSDFLSPNMWVGGRY